MADPHPSTVVTVDFFDEIFLRERAVTAQDIVDFLTPLKAAGVGGVAWRLTFLGQAVYRSQVLSPPFFDGEDYRFWMDWLKRRFATCGVPEPEAHRRASIQWMQETLQNIDPPAVAREVCRKLGLKLILWYDLFDGWHPGSYDPFLRDNPRFCWTDRSGSKYLRGVASYAFPENVTRALRVSAECRQYQPDAWYLCCSCHSTHLPEHPDALQDGYGFEPPVLERYRQKWQRDPLRDPLDVGGLDAIRGAFMTELFVRWRAALPPSAGLILPLQMHPNLIKTSPYWEGPAALRYFQDYQAWINQGIAQGLVLGDYEHLFEWTPNWVTKGGLPQRASDTWPIDQCDRLLPDIPWERCAIYLFGGWLYSRKMIPARLDAIRQAQRRYPRAGAWLHELAGLEQNRAIPELQRLT